jgi:ATP-dependent DNA helicase RecQ
MEKIFRTILKDHIQSITKKTKPILLVMKGFSNSLLSSIEINKLINFPLGGNLNELSNSKATLLPEVLQKALSENPQITWCTFEEYLTIGEEILTLYFDINIFKNNLYHKTFPLNYKISGLDELYNDYFKNDDILDKEYDHPSFKLFTSYYGGLKRIEGKFYISYTEEPSENELSFFPKDYSIKIHEQSVYEPSFIELSEDEDPFLALIEKVLSGNLKSQELKLAYSGELDSFPNNYYERITILQKIVSNDVKIELVTKALSEKEKIEENDYREILKRHWGFHNFRNIKMYKNVNDAFRKKETIEISQSQIIDDIVKQAVAANKGEYFKDIFVTSPTGAGKSIMFQIPAIYLAEKYQLMTIIISPLIGLMKDQVENMQQKAIDISATINSEVTPVEKMEIIEKIKNGSISILYISPETLLSRSDIKLLIGERKVGLFVIDEAHIVTTWGKAFRSDYWYLGSYLQKIRKEMPFPIATFTATAIYGGIEDMYAETRDSLNLINPISYFGYIKRDDIQIHIQQSKRELDKFNEYLNDKFRLMLFRISIFLKRSQKTLVYFPTISLIHQFKEYVTSKDRYVSDQLVTYYGSMTKDEKNESFLKYRNGEAMIMLATKAFGMGIDIPDISNVCHFAPTGNVCDYVQEIGRAARNLEKGHAYFDYLNKDFIHVNRLHGISTIRKYQLIQVMQKIKSILEQNKGKDYARNLLVNSEDFRYIFEKKSLNDQNEDIDNKLKTALLIIEKDFIAKLNYSPIVARPRSVFAKEYFLIEKDYEEEIQRHYKRYFRLVTNKATKENNIYSSAYTLDMKLLWEDKFNQLSFPQFKFKFHRKELDLPFSNHLLAVLQLELDLLGKNQTTFMSAVEKNIGKLAEILGNYSRNNKFFNEDDFAGLIQKQLGLKKYASQNLASIFLQSADNYDRLKRKHSNFYNRFLKYDERRNVYSIKSGFANFTDWIITESRKILNGSTTVMVEKDRYRAYIAKSRSEEIEKVFLLLGILEALGILIYRVNGGDNPEIFIRINSLLQIDKAISQPEKYKNIILENVYKRHRLSVEMLTYLFENEVKTEQFWDLIEDYFLGKVPEEVMRRYKEN